MIKTPSFWYKKPGVLCWILMPVSWVYLFLGWARSFLIRSRRVSIPVISVGNIVMGGSGKTPVAIALAKALQGRGFHPHFVTRGYGGSLKGPVRVEADKQTYHDVGDEALLLVRQAPTWVAAKRYEGALCAQEAGATHIILDDGHQHPTLHKDLSVLVFDGRQGIGNGAVFPAGPLRESRTTALSRAHAVLVIGDDCLDMPLPCYTMTPQMNVDHLPRVPLLAFAGLGFPQKFFTGLQNLGCSLADTVSFPDHHPYTDHDMEKLMKMAKDHGAKLVTTKKDLLRIPSRWHQHIVTVPLTLELPKTFIDQVVHVK